MPRPTSITSMLATAGAQTTTEQVTTTPKKEVDPVKQAVDRTLFKFDPEIANDSETPPDQVVFHARIVMVRPANQSQLATAGLTKGDFSVLRIADIDYTQEIPKLLPDGTPMTDEAGDPVLINPSVHWHVSKPIPTTKAKAIRSQFLDIIRPSTGRMAIKKQGWDNMGFEAELDRNNPDSVDDILSQL